MPVAIRHAHDGGGDKAHRHDAAAGHDRELGHHHHHHGAEHHHEHEHVAAAAVLADFVLHLHWNLLGLDFCVPASEEGEEEEDGAWRLALIRPVDGLPACVGGPDSQGLPLVAAPVPGPPLVAAETSPAHPPNSVTSIPLCDSARLERSGVLLA